MFLTLFLIAMVGSLGQVLAGLNAYVGRKLGLIEASWTFFTVGALLLTILVRVTEGGLNVETLSGLPIYFFFPGLVNVLLIILMIRTTTVIGVTFMGCGMFTGQMVMSLFLDHIGFMGLNEIPINTLRIFAVVVLLVGMARLSFVELRQGLSKSPLTAQEEFLTTQEQFQPALQQVRWHGLLLAFLIGAIFNMASGLNSVLGKEVGIMTATWLFLAPGAALLSPYIFIKRRQLFTRKEFEWLYLVPGALNIIVVSSIVFFVAVVGLQMFSGTLVGAGVVAALFIDRFGLWGLSPREISTHRLQGVAIILAGVLFSAISQ